MRRFGDWPRQAKADVSAAKVSLAGGHFEWACFQAQQAAEKAAKAYLHFLGLAERGHSATALLVAAGITEQRLVDMARVLDRYYIPTRYPDSFDSGAPTDYFDLNSAQEAVKYAENIIEYVEART